MGDAKPPIRAIDDPHDGRRHIIVTATQSTDKLYSPAFRSAHILTHEWLEFA
jgi:hypothetical protein